jgi:hypothetical protein
MRYLYRAQGIDKRDTLYFYVLHVAYGDYSYVKYLDTWKNNQ